LPFQRPGSPGNHAQLLSTYVVLDSSHSATPVEVTPNVLAGGRQEPRRFQGPPAGRALRFAADWPTWEIHPKGDEIVVLLSGSAEMVLDEKGGHRSVRLSSPGEFVVVPKGTWHTAKISVPTAMFFITARRGHREPGHLR